MHTGCFEWVPGVREHKFPRAKPMDLHVILQATQCAKEDGLHVLVSYIGSTIDSVCAADVSI